jgi:long-subunit acyl-CoA synthetase (AMP-forming)
MTTTAEPQLHLDRPPPDAVGGRQHQHQHPARSRPTAAEGADALPALLGWHSTRRGGAPALRHKTRGAWVTWSWSDLLHEVVCLARGLGGLGFGPGDVLVLLGQTSARHLVLALAAQARGGAVLPVSDALAPEAVAAAARATEARRVFAFASDERQVDRLFLGRLHLGAVPLEAILFDDRRGLGAGDSDLRLHAYEALRTAGDSDPAGHTGDLLGSIASGGLPHRSTVHPSVLPGSWPARLTTVDGRAPDPTAGSPDLAGPEDEALLLDPLSESSGAALFAHWLLSGSCLSCLETDGSPEEDRLEIAPTYLLASSAWYARLRNDIEARLPPPGSWRRRFIAAALERCARADARPSSAARSGLVGRLLDQLASVLVARPLSRALGLGRARVAVSVGQPLGAEESALLASVGIATLHLAP